MKPMSRIYPVSEIAKNEWSDWAMYTITDRAIPHIGDGLKPSQRFVLYSSIKNTPKDFKRVSSVAGVVADLGYHHAEGSASGALSLMAAPWNNNVCLVEGRGDFGTRLAQKIGAPRYVTTRLHENFHKYVKDIEHAPVHEDPENIPPKFFVPVIPLVLVNGIRGMASAFATNILPRDPVAVAKACLEYLDTGDIKERIPLKFPQFSGPITYDSEADRYSIYGKIERKGKTQLLISEVPYGYDRESYIIELDKLETDGKIVGYDDLCGKEGFKFMIKLKNGSDKMSDSQLLSMFKLIKNMTENLTVITFEGLPKRYTDERDVIKDFVDYRLGNTLVKRIDAQLKRIRSEIRWDTIKKIFITAVLDDKIVFKGKGKKEVGDQIASIISDVTQEEIDRLLRIQILSLTGEMVKELDKELEIRHKELVTWERTTPVHQYGMDLRTLLG